MNEEFDNPKLKSAVKRVWGTQAAPPLLRARIGLILSESGQSLSAAPNMSIVPKKPLAGGSPFSQRVIGYAIAASILLFAGVMTWWPIGKAFPETVAQNMVDRHDSCILAPDHHLLPGVAPNDFPAIANKLSEQLKVPVISTALKGWTFAGAGPCPVWGHPTAHLLYRNGNNTMSVFSMPASDFYVGDASSDYTAKISDHALAGFMKDGGLYCVVLESPDGTIPLQQARDLRDDLQKAFNAVSYSAPQQARTTGGNATIAYSR